MTPIKINIGQYEVYSSGTVVGNVNEEIKFFIEDLIFEIVFKTNKEQPEQKLSQHQPNDKSLTIEFVNFNNSLGSGNRVPIQVGTIGEKILYLNFRVYSLADDAGKLLHYSWLLKQKEGGNNG